MFIFINCIPIASFWILPQYVKWCLKCVHAVQFPVFPPWKSSIAKVSSEEGGAALNDAEGMRKMNKCFTPRFCPQCTVSVDWFRRGTMLPLLLGSLLGAHHEYDWCALGRSHEGTSNSNSLPSIRELASSIKGKKTIKDEGARSGDNKV